MVLKDGRRPKVLVISHNLVNGVFPTRERAHVEESDAAKVTTVTQFQAPGERVRVPLTNEEFEKLASASLDSFDSIYMYVKYTEPRFPLDYRTLMRLDRSKVTLVVSPTLKHEVGHGGVMKILERVGFKNTRIIDPDPEDTNGIIAMGKIREAFLTEGDFKV